MLISKEMYNSKSNSKSNSNSNSNPKSMIPYSRQNLSLEEVCLGAANLIELLLFSMFAQVVNINTVQVLSEFAWAAKCVKLLLFSGFA